MPQYFQGTSVKGHVKESVHTTFVGVVDSFDICPTLGITRAKFLALNKEQRNEIKQVPFFVAACFKESPSRRLLENATVCNLLFIDIDETKDGKCPAAPFYNNPDSLFAALQGYNFAAYVTASSTPQKPRMRIVVDCDALPVQAYPRAVGTIGALLGLARITTESRVAVQPMFLPTQFRDSTEHDHPLIADRTDGRAFQVSDISDSLFPEYEEPKAQQADSTDALFFLRAPIPEITLAIAKEALDAIDPDCAYFDWLECANALRHQFSPHKAEDAFNLFDEWSAEGSKYGGEKETRAKWNSIRPTPIGRLPVTIRSLLRQAVASGWDDKRVKDLCFNSLVRWMEEAESITELIEKGVHKILSTPLLTAVQEAILVDQLCQQARKRFAYTIPATAIRKDLARTKAEIKAQSKPNEKTKEPKWAKGMLYVAATQDFFRHRTGEKYRMESFNAMYGRQLLPTEDALKELGIPVTPAALSKPIVAPSEFVLNHLKIPTVYDYAYDPSQPTEVWFVNRGRKFVNTYSPTYPELDRKHAESAGKLFQNHLTHLIAEEEYRRTLTDFMAFMVQSPGRKIRWAVLIQSVEGGGKTFLAETMKAVLGSEHVKTISGDAIKSGYNEWSFGHQLVVLEEVRVAGTNKYEIMNALKPLVTNEGISINQKFKDNGEAVSTCNYMLFSNHHDALALTPGDRRYFVLKSPMQNRSQVLALGDDYFPPLYAMLRDKAGALRAYLDEWSVSPSFNADGHAPRTRYVHEMINDGASDLAACVKKLLLEADYPLVQFDIVSAKTLMDALHLEEGMGQITSQKVSHVLREEGFKQIGRHLFGTDRHYLWCRNGVDETTAVEIAFERERKGVKNLCMELLF